ncbi:MAG: TrmH family RNA methyltransferase [Pseudomonadota bacterium]
MTPPEMNPTTCKFPNVAVVLCHTSLPENIGVSARAAANMGLGRLLLVDPFRLEPEVMMAAATRAGQPLIERLEVFPTLAEALAGFQYVIGTTARRGSHRGPFFNPETMARKVVELGPDVKVALVFGPERSGLTTEDLRFCQAVVRIPTADPKVSSLNLAQAVLILGYELLLAQAPTTPPSEFKSAPMGEIEETYQRLSEILVSIGFLPDENTGHWLMSFKRIFNRSGLTHGDCNLLRGVCRQMDWALAQAAKTGRAGRFHEDRAAGPAVNSSPGSTGGGPGPDSRET